MRLHLTPEVKRAYEAWRGMKSRCYYRGNTEYHNYGKRGIIVCDSWKESFDKFLEDVGTPPSIKHSIDRYPNRDGNYEPGNVRWATAKQQAENRRNSLPPITHNGITKTLSDWARQFGLSPVVLKYRLEVNKMSFEEATTTPMRKKPIFIEHREEIYTAKDFATMCKLPYSVVCNRLSDGWSSERIISTPYKKMKPRRKKKSGK